MLLDGSSATVFGGVFGQQLVGNVENIAIVAVVTGRFLSPLQRFGRCFMSVLSSWSPLVPPFEGALAAVAAALALAVMDFIVICRQGFKPLPESTKDAEAHNKRNMRQKQHTFLC